MMPPEVKVDERRMSPLVIRDGCEWARWLTAHGYLGKYNRDSQPVRQAPLHAIWRPVRAA